MQDATDEFIQHHRIKLEQPRRTECSILLYGDAGTVPERHPVPPLHLHRNLAAHLTTRNPSFRSGNENEIKVMNAIAHRYIVRMTHKMGTQR